MIEYGEVLPGSGKEKVWFSKLSKKLMESAAKSLNFADAIFHRDNLSILQHELKNRKK